MDIVCYFQEVNTLGEESERAMWFMSHNPISLYSYSVAEYLMAAQQQNDH